MVIFHITLSEDDPGKSGDGATHRMPEELILTSWVILFPGMIPTTVAVPIFHFFTFYSVISFIGTPIGYFPYYPFRR